MVESITLGGGCFWCLEAVFERIRGVVSVTSGYSGGNVVDPSYQLVCTGSTGHAEVVQLEFEPEVISLGAILNLFFSIHDPTTLNRQGHDVGPQYRSVVFYNSPEQKGSIDEMMADIRNDSGKFSGPVVTEISPLINFYAAEDYHMEYYRNNIDQPYCRIVIDPKIAKLKKEFRDLLR